MSAIRKMLNLKGSKIRKIILRICAAILAISGIKAHTDKVFRGYFVPPEKNDMTKNEKLPEDYIPIKTVNLSNVEAPQIMQLKGGHHGNVLLLKFSQLPQ